MVMQLDVLAIELEHIIFLNLLSVMEFAAASAFRSMPEQLGQCEMPWSVNADRVWPVCATSSDPSLGHSTP